MKYLVVANWKMHPHTLIESRELFDAIKKVSAKHEDVSVVVAPPTAFLHDCANRAKAVVDIAAQDGHYEAIAAETGLTSIAQIASLGAQYCLVGHAEMRARGDTNEIVGFKVAAALEAGMVPIVCVGETERRDDLRYLAVLTEQLSAAVIHVPKTRSNRIVIAYEPVWTIGAPRPMHPRDLLETCIFIRKTLVGRFGESAVNVPVLYGGSVDETNAREMVEHGGAQGLLVGRASLDSKKFGALIASLHEKHTE
jgi:triosephosphate isomerase (TIM)